MVCPLGADRRRRAIFEIRRLSLTAQSWLRIANWAIRIISGTIHWQSCITTLCDTAAALSLDSMLAAVVSLALSFLVVEVSSTIDEGYFLMLDGVGLFDDASYIVSQRFLCVVTTMTYRSVALLCCDHDDHHGARHLLAARFQCD